MSFLELFRSKVLPIQEGRCNHPRALRVISRIEKEGRRTGKGAYVAITRGLCVSFLVFLRERGVLSRRASKYRQNRPDSLPGFWPSWISGWMATAP